MKNFLPGLIAIMLFTVSCVEQTCHIAVINSYHNGYDPSDKAMKSIKEILSPEKIKITFFELDSKRLTEEMALRRVDSVLASLKAIKPDLIIAADDYAVKNVIEPQYSGSKIPVVFCGVNWSLSGYNLTSNITGILEVLPLKEAIDFLKKLYPGAEKISILSESSLSEQNNTLILDTLYKNSGLEPEYMLVNEFSKWKELFIQASRQSDIIYLPTNGSINGWDDEEAAAFVKDQIKIPVFTCDDFMMPYCVAGFTKVASEQGEWAAETALRILRGTKPSEIPVSQNRQSKIWFNPVLAEKIGFRPDNDWLTEAVKFTSQ